MRRETAGEQTGKRVDVNYRQLKQAASEATHEPLPYVSASRPNFTPIRDKSLILLKAAQKCSHKLFQEPLTPRTCSDSSCTCTSQPSQTEAHAPRFCCGRVTATATA